VAWPARQHLANAVHDDFDSAGIGRFMRHGMSEPA
jgi:hypothetical protein